MLAYERLDVDPVGQSVHDHELDAFAPARSCPGTWTRVAGKCCDRVWPELMADPNRKFEKDDFDDDWQGLKDHVEQRAGFLRSYLDQAGGL